MNQSKHSEYNFWEKSLSIYYDKSKPSSNRGVVFILRKLTMCLHLAFLEWTYLGTRVDALIKWILGAKISHEDFVEKSVSSNQIALRIGTAFGVLFELCNIYRVLFFRDIMVNRLIYLRFYLVYLACCVVFLIVDFCFKMSDMVRHRFYMISVGMILFWEGMKKSL